MTRPLSHITRRTRAAGNSHGQMARIKVGLAPDVFDHVADMAARANVPVSALMRRIVTDHVKKIARIGGAS